MPRRDGAATAAGASKKGAGRAAGKAAARDASTASSDESTLTSGSDSESSSSIEAYRGVEKRVREKKVAARKASSAAAKGVKRSLAEDDSGSSSGSERPVDRHKKRAKPDAPRKTAKSPAKSARGGRKAADGAGTSASEYSDSGDSSSSEESSSTGTDSSDSESGEEERVARVAPRARATPADTAARRQKLEEARRKREATTKAKVEKHHPELKEVWSAVDLSVRYDRKAKTKREASSQPPALTTKLLPFQLEGLAWMRQQEDSAFKGGILADEMGMGKTIQTIALLVAQERLGPNLILTPTVALLQWNEEILKHTLPGTLKVMVYHGSDRPATAEELTSCDVVLSTYSIVESSHRKQHYGFRRKGQLVKEKSLLHSIAFDRIVLDEAHSIKDRSCSTARAVFALQCDKKWCLSGTPLQNRVGELYSLLRFLKCDPFAYYFCSGCSCKSLSWAFSDRRNCDDCGHKPMAHFCWWNREILKPIQNYGGEQEDGQVAFRKLSHLLDKIMLRRTKLERAADLGLPPRVVIVRRDYFGEEEEDLYNSLYGDAKRKFDTYVAEDRVLNNYANIFELLMRMRQASNHPDLVTKKALVSGNQKVNALVCGICHEPAEDAVVSSCKHTFCREDVSQYMEGCADPTPKCPVCFRNLNIDLSQPGVQLSDAAEADKKMRASIVNYLDFSRWRSSTKIEALVEELQNLRSNDATVKAICFSQFTNFLDLVHWRLQRSGFTCVKLDGRMSPQQRANIITAFNTDPKITVFLISLKAGGIALNLTEASAVFMLDPWWNPAVEDQAMDRIHRLGQHRPIKITRIIIENSIESRILQLQEKKKLLFESTVGKDMDALAKLTEDDLKFLFVL